MAKQLAQLLEPHRPLFIEEPLLPGHVNELKDLYNKTTIPIAVSAGCKPVAWTQADYSARRAIIHTS
jgi:L-alanine-DL-glutamate epimerase-like enolase superfamily enzyme